MMFSTFGSLGGCCMLDLVSLYISECFELQMRTTNGGKLQQDEVVDQTG